MIDPEGLLKTALCLAHAGEEHSPEDLRRAISTAYYAAFHALTGMIADALAGSNSPEWGRVYRALDHGVARTACVNIRNANLGHEIEAVAKRFVELQKQRHQADYDPGFTPSQTVALDAIWNAGQVLALIHGMSSHLRRDFALRLLVQSPKGRGP